MEGGRRVYTHNPTCWMQDLLCDSVSVSVCAGVSVQVAWRREKERRGGTRLCVNEEGEVGVSNPVPV